MQETVKTILSAKRWHRLHRTPVFQHVADTTEMELFMIAKRLDCKLTIGLSKWLRTAGYGDINGTLFFREDCFDTIRHGTLAGYVLFARDELGHRYAFNPVDGAVYYVDQQHHAYARLSNDFMSFLNELIRRDYDLAAWRSSLVVQNYSAD